MLGHDFNARIPMPVTRLASVCDFGLQSGREICLGNNLQGTPRIQEKHPSLEREKAVKCTVLVEWKRHSVPCHAMPCSGPIL